MGCHQYLSHIIFNLSPNQKLSKPVPIKGFLTKLRQMLHTSVLPVNVISRFRLVTNIFSMSIIKLRIKSIKTSRKIVILIFLFTIGMFSNNNIQIAIIRQPVEVELLAVRSNQNINTKKIIFINNPILSAVTFIFFYFFPFSFISQKK